ncbi:MAG: HK97 family phage prohead protease [Lactococcus chungangensis]|uniref:HK97 family phage prohead protease n=1 Tax=Pseudolactococcus chungangensis TaxID=451457 RepID=A0A847J1S2_9LACT|nr:HK97 family phage prohead protease [Lactococcus chungangensis]
MNNRKSLQARDIGQLDNNQEATDKKIISGYFIVFDTETELYPGVREEVSPDALVGVDLSDVKALIDHDTAKVLGRTKANTLSLSVDSKGLYGEIIVNESDQEAMNLYSRVQRGDVDQCSFGFEILNEEMIQNSDGTVKFIIKSINLYEVSVVTFPAYQETAVEARSKQIEDAQKRTLQSRKGELKEKLNGIKTTYFVS